MKSPIFDANPFGTDEEMELWDKQHKAFNNFYQNLLPKVSALQWTDGRKTMIFSRDTISNLVEYRVSAFDEKGAIYHVTRETIERLLHAESFPCDGRELEIVY